MKVLDASFLIDYEHGVRATAEYLQNNPDEAFVVPSTVYAEYLLGEANAVSEPDLPAVRAELEWTEVWPVTRETADLGVETAAELSPEAPNIDGVDATVLGVAREAGAPIVAGDSDITHEAVREVVDVEPYVDQSS